MAHAPEISTNSRIEEFIETYQQLRHAAGDKMLSRANLRLEAVRVFAKALTIVDVSEPDFWNVRLSGTKACERLGSDTTGRNAQIAFSDEERDRRKQLAYILFDNPCGIRSMSVETHANGDQTTLDTVALPLAGKNDEMLVVHYAEVIDDIHHGFRDRPAVERSDLISYELIDLGFGVPEFPPFPSLRAA